MKIKLYSIVFVILILFSNCSKDDELEILNPEIVFVHQDGSTVVSGECIDSKEQYALQITIKSKSRGTFKPIKVDYTLNGIVKSVIFTELGTRTVPVSFIDGMNIVQIVESGITFSVDVKLSCKATISANSIAFVYADGSAIPADACLDLNSAFAVKIDAVIEVEGNIEATKIGYTINGVAYSTTFTNAGTQIIPVSLKVGENISQLSDSGIAANISIVQSCKASILVDEISFVYADGFSIPLGACLDLKSAYAVKIKTKVEGDGPVESTNIKYTINGILYSMEFSGSGSKMNLVSIKLGQNIARVFSTNLESEINFIAQGDFELVE